MVLQIAGALLILGVLLGFVGFIFFLLENIHRLNIQPKPDFPTILLLGGLISFIAGVVLLIADDLLTKVY